MKRTIMIIAAVVVLYLAYELSVFAYKYYHLPVLPSIDLSDETLGSGPALTYVAAGDSTGVGYGASSEKGTYTYKIAEFLAKDHSVEYKNVSVSGAETGDILKAQVPQIIALKPDVITISMGANDATHLVATKKILDNYKAIIGALERGTSAKIYITDIPNFTGATILPWFYDLFLEYRSGQINPRLLALADGRVKMVNIHDSGWSTPPYNDRAATYAADHFHPNDLGYQNWANAFLDVIKN
jgi:acyl-CoA thioesterase-1